MGAKPPLRGDGVRRLTAPASVRDIPQRADGYPSRPSRTSLSSLTDIPRGASPDGLASLGLIPPCLLTLIIKELGDGLGP